MSVTVAASNWQRKLAAAADLRDAGTQLLQACEQQENKSLSCVTEPDRLSEYFQFFNSNAFV